MNTIKEKRIIIAATPEEHERIKNRATEQYMSISNYVRRLIDRDFAQMEEEANNKKWV